MNKLIGLIVLTCMLLGNTKLRAQTCANDTVFSDVVFVIDNSGSIDSTEFVAFANIIQVTINKVQAACTEAQVAVVHYGGNFGQETVIEYPLSKNNNINAITRQFCTSLNQFGFCVGGGGDDLNFAMGELMTYFGNGSLNHNTDNNLSIVIFTDAFDGATSCNQPNCSILRPFTNVDLLKANFNASVTVVGASSQANAAILQVYASPGGTYDLVNLDSDCTTSFDGCVQPRKYIPIEFNSDVVATSDSILSCVTCQIQVVAGMQVDAGVDQTICGDLSQIATLTATGSVGQGPYTYSWSNGAGTGPSVMVIPATTTTYFVTATDALTCTAIDSVTVTVEDCCTTFTVDAGPDVDICGDLGESTILSATATGSGTSFSYNWNQGLGAGALQTVTPTSTITYEVTATDNIGCTDIDQVTVNVLTCGPSCDPDTTFSDVIFLIDNSGSIDDSEYAAFENIILQSLNDIRTSCTSSNQAVVHYGGLNGTSTSVEYDLGNTQINTINRQFCTARDQFDLCVGGGGDDLNHAIGDIMTFLTNGTLNRDPSNKLSLVILTDAFGFGTTCPQPNCSLILPTTNIDNMKAMFDVDVSVVGVSSQAEEVLLGIYASLGGTFNSPLFQAECTGSFDGCQLPRKYVQIEFNTSPQVVSDVITSFVECTVEVMPPFFVDAGEDTTICTNLGESATLMASVVPGFAGVPPYVYQWSDGLGTAQTVTATPLATKTYYVTATDANLCTAVDSVVVNGIICDDCLPDAGTPLPPNELCLENGQAFLPSESNTGVILPQGFDIVYILTNEDLTIIDYSVGFRNFIVNEAGLYRIHTLVAEVTNPASDDYLDLNIIKVNESNLFIIVNCIVDHDICADFDYPGRVHLVFGPEDMMCMTFENSINLCMDGIDNDGDGLIDCADEECKPLINCLENTLLACNDLTDNDGDGLVDCFDSDCFGFTVCFERGANCNDGIDNDGDGLIDCADNSCDGSAPCLENSPFTCIDGRDNDGNGLVDCADPQCQKYLVCAEYSEAACQDGIDNDFDGLVDCADGGCKEILGEACNPDETTIDKCSDGVDNDGDGLVDCADPDCRTVELDDLAFNIDQVIEIINATCPDNDNGSIRFVGIANNPNFQYSIDGGENYISSPLFTGLDVGPYDVSIRSALGCALHLTVDVTGLACIEICSNGIDDDNDGLVDCDDNQCGNPDPYTPQIINIVAADCPTFSNGTFSIAGIPGGVLYSIDGINYQSLPKFSGLSDGHYNLIYKDQNGCYAGVEVVIPVSSKVCVPDEICDNGIDDDQDGLVDCEDTEDCPLLDSDGDGICDSIDQCPDFDDALIGTPCDDGDPCTNNDVYTDDCNCTGHLIDDDGDGICDIDDQCPSLDDSLIGTACDDSDACTSNDTYRTDCTCRGDFVDSDGDGICDIEDQCPNLNDGLIGSTCDDGDVCTVNDIYGTDCNCAGDFIDSDSDGVCDNDDPCPTVSGIDCPEICNNGLDDDGDGLIDCEDLEDCQFDGQHIIDIKTSNNVGADSYVSNKSNFINTIFGSASSLISEEAMENGNTPYHIHSFINFAIADIFDEANIVIESATMTLYGDPSKDQTGNNASLIHLLSEPWEENSINYDNRPDYNPDFFVTIPRNNDFDRMELDIKLLFEKVIEEDLSFHGFIIQPREKTPSRAMVFASREHPDQTRTPEIHIVYRADCLYDEICNNGIDDDGDGLIDCADGDCCDDNNCESLTVTLETDDTACDVGLGKIRITNYDPSIEYYIDPQSPTFNNGEFDSLAAGIYSLTATSACESITLDSIFVLDNCPPPAIALQTTSLDLTVMLQGACPEVGGLMSTELNKGGYLPGQDPVTYFGTATPAGQPFNQAPWFYEGDEGKKLKSNNKADEGIYEADVVDWVLVSLRIDPSKQSEIWKGAGLLYSDGSIRLFESVVLESTKERGYHIVIEHRNHLPVMSHNRVQVIDGQISYDFTEQDSYSSIIGIGQVRDEELGYMMVAGNGELIVELSSDIDINARDLTMWLQKNGANSSYFLEDYDMNGDINIKDRILWEKNNGLFTTLQTK